MSSELIVDRQVLCIDIGGTSTKGGVLFPDGKLELVHPIPTTPDVGSYFSCLLELTQNVRTAAPDAVQLGVSVAGFLDDARTRLIYNPNLEWLQHFPLKERLAAELPDLQIELETDSNAATVAEYRLGSGKGTRRFLCVTCGTGLGVGMTVDGQVLRFAYGCMGDIGHVIVQRDGPECPCGGRGCAEAMISTAALAERYCTKAQIAGPVTFRNVIDRAQSGDTCAVQILTEAGEWLGVAIASMANTLFPDYIAIAGGLSAAGDLLIRAAERVFRESAGVAVRERVTIAKAQLGAQASLVGAAWPFFCRQPPVR